MAARSVVAKDMMSAGDAHGEFMKMHACGFDATLALLRSPMAFLAQHPAWKTAGVRAMESLGMVEAARNAQGRLRLMGLSIDEREMPREGDLPRTERWTLPVVGDKALRKRQASWEQPLAEAATKTEPLADSAARLHQLGETRTHCGSRRTKGRNVPRWMTWSSASMQECGWTFQ